MHLLGGGGEVGMDLDGVEVGDDQQGRVFEVVLVAQQLVVGFDQVLVRPLVLPGEVSAVPDIGPAVAAGRFGGATFEGEEVAGRVQVRRASGWSRTRQRSRKCCCDAERSVRSTPIHFR